MNKVVDERVVAVRHRIMNEAANVTTALLLLSIFYQAFVLDLDVSYYLFEGIVFIGVSAYIMVRYIMTGTLHLSTNPEGDTKWINSKKRKLIINAISYLVFL